MGVYTVVRNQQTIGRAMLMTDEAEITKKNIISVVSKAYEEHQKNVFEELYLFNYERGNQPILDREKSIRSEINTKVVENNASMIVDTHVGYCFSNPITYVQRAKVEAGKESDGKKDDLSIATLNKMMQEQAKGAKDIALARDLFICGVGYQMILPHRNKKKFSPFEIMVPNPMTTFVVYSNDAYREPKLGCTYSIHDDGRISLTAYSDKLCYCLERKSDKEEFRIIQGTSFGIFGWTEKITPNPLGMIPIVEFALNDRMGIFEKVIPILDALNLIDSDRINDNIQHVQSLLWMHNCQVDKEGKKNLVDGDGVIVTKSNGDGKEAKITYLGDTLDQSQIQALVEHLISQAEKITATPSWKEASGGSTTGAMQLSNGWQCLEIWAKTMEQMFTEPEMRILELAIQIIDNDIRRYEGLKDIEVADIEVRFCRNKTYDLVSKTNSLVALINCGVDGLTAFNTVGLFTDPQQAWCDSEKIITSIQKKLAAKKEEQVSQLSPNAYKDEDGNGGENNKEKDKTEESMQPSKVAGITE